MLIASRGSGLPVLNDNLPSIERFRGSFLLLGPNKPVAERRIDSKATANRFLLDLVVGARLSPKL
jgi:hypothetical protein